MVGFATVARHLAAYLSSDLSAHGEGLGGCNDPTGERLRTLLLLSAVGQRHRDNGSNLPRLREKLRRRRRGAASRSRLGVNERSYV
jgi:hypothetical protein